MTNEQVNMMVLFGLAVYCFAFYHMVRYINKPCKY
jgi:hypothetical protein